MPAIRPCLGEFDPRPFWETLVDWGRAFADRLPHILAGILIIVLFWFVSGITRHTIVATGQRARMDAALAGMLGRLASIAMFLIGLGVAAVVILPSFRPVDLIAGLGITSIAIGFALKDILQNFFAGILLLWQKPFRVGDQVKIKDFEGTVEEISIRSTQLRTYDGEQVVLPNGDVYVSPIVVRTAYDRRRLQVKLALKDPAALDRARALIRDVVKGTDSVLAEPPPEVRAENLSGGSVSLSVLFWVKPDHATAIKVNDDVLAGIRKALGEAEIALA